MASHRTTAHRTRSGRLGARQQVERPHQRFRDAARGLRLLLLHVRIRDVLASVESRCRGSAQLARVAFAGALTGIAGMSMALVIMAAASSEGANANPVVSRAVTAERPAPSSLASPARAFRMTRDNQLVGRPVGRFPRPSEHTSVQSIAEPASAPVRPDDDRRQISPHRSASTEPNS